MLLHVQDPEDPSAPFLLEALLEACKGATSGGALFAFASHSGLKLLMEDKTFAKFAAHGKFDLIVGLDAVTDQQALKTLNDFMIAEPNILGRAFLHTRNRALFHPKTSWFRRKGSGGTLITGSGNLTVGGLRANWEAFNVVHLTENEAKKIQHQWNTLLSLHATKLLAPDAIEALERASRNRLRDARPRPAKKTKQPPPSGDTATEVSAEIVEASVDELIAPDSIVLIAELPKASDRWNQANFSLATFEGFFGAKAGKQSRVLLQHVALDGSLEDLESRPAIAVRSRNFRFELQAARHLPYPAKGRPVAVFVRQLTGIFLYRLVLPNDAAAHTAVSDLLEVKWNGPTRQMRRVTTTATELQEYWPDAPFWRVATTPE